MVNIFNNKTDDRTIELTHEGMLERETGIWGSMVTIQSSRNELEKSLMSIRRIAIKGNTKNCMEYREMHK